MYDAYQRMADAGDQVRMFAENANAILSAWSANPFAPPVRRMAAYYELVALAGFSHSRPEYGIDFVEVHDEPVPVEEKGVAWTPFCQLLRFRREGRRERPEDSAGRAHVGAFRHAFARHDPDFLKDHQVFITDWTNPRNVPLGEGGFNLEDYTQHLVDFVNFIGEDCHIVAVCQPTVSALVATTVMAQDNSNVQPASLTLMAGPIDGRIAPTKVNELAIEKPIEWFRSHMIGVVPDKFEGAGRRVYPGFLQLCAFMSMNADRHTKSFVELFQLRVAGDAERADAIRDFYKEYFAIMDMSADFYLETVDQVFQRFLLPQGLMKHKGRVVEPRAIKDFPAHRGGRAGRHLRRRPDAGCAGSLQRPPALHEDTPSSGRRRPLRSLQRQALGDAGLPGAPQSHPVEPVAFCCSGTQACSRSIARRRTGFLPGPPIERGDAINDSV